MKIPDNAEKETTTVCLFKGFLLKRNDLIRKIYICFAIFCFVLPLIDSESLAGVTARRGQDVSMQDAVNYIENKLAWEEFVLERKNCLREAYPDLCIEKAWLKLQRKLTIPPGLDKVPGFEVPPWLQPVYDIVKMEEKKIKEQCDPLENAYRNMYKEMRAAENNCDFKKAMQLRNQIVIALGLCPESYIFKTSRDIVPQVISDRQKVLHDAEKEFNKLVSDAKKAQGTCKVFNGNFKEAPIGILEDCRPEWNAYLDEMKIRTKDTNRQFHDLERKAEATLNKANGALTNCRGISSAILDVERIKEQKLLLKCNLGLMAEVSDTWNELKRFEKNYEGFINRSNTVLKNAENAIDQCKDLDWNLSGVQDLLNSPMYQRCPFSEIAPQTVKTIDRIIKLQDDLNDRRSRIKTILHDANWAIHKCDWQALEKNQSRAMNVLPTGNCLANNKEFLELNDEVHHGLLTKKRRRKQEIKPLYDKILAHILKRKPY